MLYVLVLLFFSLSVFLFFMLRRAVNIISDLEDESLTFEKNVSKHLKFFNNLHKSFDKRSKMDIFYDEPVVKDTIKDIKLIKQKLKSIIQELEEQIDESGDKNDN